MPLIEDEAKKWLDRPIERAYWALYVDGTNFKVQRRESTAREMVGRLNPFFNLSLGCTHQYQPFIVTLFLYLMTCLHTPRYCFAESDPEVVKRLDNVPGKLTKRGWAEWMTSNQNRYLSCLKVADIIMLFLSFECHKRRTFFLGTGIALS